MHSPNVPSGHKAADLARLARRFRQASQIIAILVTTLGLLVLCGWALNLSTLTHIRPAFQSMKVNAALAFVCLGAALWLARNDERPRSRRILGLLVVIIAGATLAEYAFHVNLGIDQLLFLDTSPALLSAYPGRMAISTAACFLLLGLAVTFLGTRKALTLQRVPVHACFAFSLVGLCGYLYGVKSLYAITSFSIVSVHTAAGFAAACLAYFLARPDEGIVSLAASNSNSGFLLRTLIPVVIVVPVLIGWLRLQGQRANFYDTPFGAALQAFASIGGLTVLTVLIVRSMHRQELERRQIAGALEKSEEKFSKAFRESPMAVTLTRLSDDHYLEVNESFERWTGWHRDQVIGRTPLDIGLWVDPAERLPFIKRLLADGAVRNLEIRYRRKDGVEMVGLGSAELIEIGNEPCAISVIADINDRKRAEQALKESESRFRLLADTAPVLIWMSGTDKLCTYFNKPWLDFTGRSLEDELGNRWTEGVHPDDFQRCLDTYTRAFDRREEFRMEYRLRRHDREYRWIFDTGVPRYAPDRSFAGYIGSCVDVTERKLADEVRFSLAAIVESSDDAILRVDTNGIVVNWNKAAERLFGYSARETIGKNISFLWLSDRPSDSSEILKKVLQGQVVRNYETVRQRKDGTQIAVSLTLSPIFDAEGRIVGTSGICRDITERKLAERAIRQSETRYRQIVETTHEGVWLLDSTLHTAYVNRQMAEMLGYAPGDMLGLSVFDFYFPEDVDYKRQILTRRRQGMHEQLEERLRRRDGSELLVRMSATPVFKDNGEFDGAFAMMSDITERKLAEEALRVSEERLRMGQWAAHIGTFDLNLRTGVDVWTPETEALYGLPPGGFAGTLMAFEDLIHPDDRKRVADLTQELIRTGQAVEAEWRVVWPDGSIHWIAGRGHVLMDASGEPSRMLGVNMDITERKQAEEALSGMTRKLIEAQEQERARIARELHDDINQRLAVLAIELGGLIRDGRNDLPPQVRSRVQELQRMTSDISSDLHTLSHELHSSTLEYLGLAKGMRNWCEEYGLRQKLNIDFKCQDIPDLPQDISLCLFRVLQEAVHNAAKYSGVKQIEVRLTDTSGEIQLIVRDSGRGFDVEAVTRGLGLTSMQERVRLVGGSIVIDSKPQTGTTVHVRVPFRAERKAQTAAG